MNKQNLTIGIAILILGLAAFNAIDDASDMSHHEAFFDEVRDFMARGGRNTAEQGYIACLAQNLNSLPLGNPTRDCCEIYYKSNIELCRQIDRFHK